MPRITGVLLTGGASSRLGQSKGARFGPAVAARLAEVCDPCFEVGPGHTGLPARPDPGEGPLRALAAAGITDDALVVACDMPRVTTGLLHWLAERPGTAVPVVDGRIQPLCARYSGRTLALAARVEGRAMRDLLDMADDVTYLDMAGWPAELFDDVDTPEDLARLEALSE